jgi:hypothetical protein
LNYNSINGAVENLLPIFGKGIALHGKGSD